MPLPSITQENPNSHEHIEMFNFVVIGDRKYTLYEYLSRLARPKELDGSPPSLLGG